jgi:hypothetical protein
MLMLHYVLFRQLLCLRLRDQPEPVIGSLHSLRLPALSHVRHDELGFILHTSCKWTIFPFYPSTCLSHVRHDELGFFLHTSGRWIVSTFLRLPALSHVRHYELGFILHTSGKWTYLALYVTIKRPYFDTLFSENSLFLQNMFW